MFRFKMPVKTAVIIAVMAVFSCSKEPVGYLEVRNLSNDTFTNVTWGELIYLGTIAPGEEKGDETESDFIKVIENYLPKMATEAEITMWVEQNIDFAEFKNKMQAMGLIMKHFGATADGNTVKKILQEM